jgi:hypothetical protein
MSLYVARIKWRESGPLVVDTSMTVSWTRRTLDSRSKGRTTPTASHTATWESSDFSDHLGCTQRRYNKYGIKRTSAVEDSLVPDRTIVTAT